MFHLTGRFSKLGVDTKKFTQSLDTIVKEVIRESAREWLRAVILHVPIWTGTAMGSLRPLGAYLRVAVPTEVKVVRKGYGPSIGKEGQEFSFDRKGNIWSFDFTEEVAHYLVNEYFNVNSTGKFHLTTPGPWRSFAAGEKAFTNYLNKSLPKRLPKLGDYLVVEELRFDS